MHRKLKVSICIPAYNEGKNILKLLNGLLKQEVERVIINKIVVVVSGCTDDTLAIVQRFAQKDKRIKVIAQETRAGKASAINLFLKEVDDEVVVIESADTQPYKDCIEKLCAPFLDDPKLGMTGGAPIPINDRNTFLGYIIHSWWWFHRNIPRFGEIIAFRNVLPHISATTAVDEAFIQAKLVQLGYGIVHIDEARVRNKGPETVKDLIKQRRRIFNGHARLYKDQNIKIDHMSKSSVYLMFCKYKLHSATELIWFMGGIAIELWSRALGAYDSTVLKINPFIWETANTTKNLIIEEEKIL